MGTMVPPGANVKKTNSAVIFITFNLPKVVSKQLWNLPWIGSTFLRYGGKLPCILTLEKVGLKLTLGPWWQKLAADLS